MRSSARIFLVMAVLIAAISMVALAGEPGWFDMEKCGFCKHLSEAPGLMENMTWEHHNISNGIVSVSTVGGEYLKTLRKAQAEMEKTGEKMQKGEKVEMCGMCTAMGQMMQKGVKTEFVQTRHGDVWLVSSDDPELVKEIQSWGERTNKELAALEGSHHKDHEECEHHKENKDHEECEHHKENKDHEECEHHKENKEHKEHKECDKHKK